MNRLRRPFPLWLLFGLLLALLPIGEGCKTAPVTQRKQLLLMGEDYETSLGAQSYNQIIAEEPPSTNPHYVEMVNRVGNRIAQAAGRPDYQWEFRVIASEQQNAFCLPGGKVAVYEGILPICQNEAGLAVVMSHEIAHALARHGGERMSQKMVSNAAGNALKYMTQGQTDQKRELMLGAYGVASKYGVILPFSRKHESEADQIGVMLMSKAGYDPLAAPLFWERFSASKQGEATPEFLSTHPSDARREMDLRALLPEATKTYELAAVKYGAGQPLQISPTSIPNTAPAIARQPGTEATR